MVQIREKGKNQKEPNLQEKLQHAREMKMISLATFLLPQKITPKINHPKPQIEALISSEHDRIDPENLMQMGIRNNNKNWGLLTKMKMITKEQEEEFEELSDRNKSKFHQIKSL